MSVAELKEKLISKIKSEDDEGVLGDWLSIMESGREAIYKLPEELMEGLDEIEAEVARGEYYTTDEVTASVNESIADALKKIK